MTPQQARAQLTAHHDTADQFTPYSLGDRVAAARIAARDPERPLPRLHARHRRGDRNNTSTQGVPTMTTEATPAGVYVRDTDGGIHWVWRDTIQKQIDWVEKHGGTAQLTTGVVRDRDQLVALMAAVKDSARAAWLDGSYREVAR